MQDNAMNEKQPKPSEKKNPPIHVARDRMWATLEGHYEISFAEKREIVWECMQRLEKSNTDPADAHRLVFWLYRDEQSHLLKLAWKVDQSIPREAEA
jgi:hypothetical protein